MPPPDLPVPPSSSDTEWYLDLPTETPGIGDSFGHDAAGYLFNGRNAPFAIHRAGMEPHKIKRGYMRPLEYSKATTLDARPLRFFFMYNPTTLSLAYQLDESVYGPQDQNMEEAITAAPGVVVSSFSFAMEIDRQIEVNKVLTAHQGRTDVTRKGIFHDFEVFDSIVRKVQTRTLTLQMTPVSVIFSPDLMLSGFVQSVSKVVAKWSPNMIPTAGTISVTMQVFYMGEVVDPATSGLPALFEQAAGLRSTNMNNNPPAPTDDDDRTGGTATAQPTNLPDPSTSAGYGSGTT